MAVADAHMLRRTSSTSTCSHCSWLRRYQWQSDRSWRCQAHSRRLHHLGTCIAAGATVSPLETFGWVTSTPPNGQLDRSALKSVANAGLATASNQLLETTPEHRNLTTGDPGCAGWTRSPNDPGVAAYRKKLRAENGVNITGAARVPTQSIASKRSGMFPPVQHSAPA